MFLSAPANPSRIKHVLYLLACTVLGIIVSYIVHASIEAAYLAWADSVGRAVYWYGGCALHPAIQIELVVLGALSGLFLGRFWWRKVYIERVWAREKKK